MRNLSVSRHRAGLLEGIFGAGEELVFLALDADTGRRFLASRGGRVRALAAEEGGDGEATGGSAGDKVLWELVLGEALPPDSSCAAPLALVAMEHVVELDALFLATACGCVMLLQPGSRAVEEVGAVPAGLLAARWSPDGEVVALLTGDSHLLLMSKEWEVIDELVLEPPAAGAEVAGSLTWRGDGQLLAANVQAEAGGCAVTILRRDPCEVVASVAPEPGLGLPIDWQPNGRHLYAVQASDAGPRVLLYEGNGLSHGGFDISKHPGALGTAQPGAAVTGLAWSADSELLALALDCSGAGGGLALQVWRRGNWHWDLKHEMRFPYAQGLSLAWDPERPECLRAFTACGELHTLHFCLAYLTSARGTVAVIDGPHLRLTPLRHCLVPPPLCAVTLAFRAAVQAAGLLSEGGAEAAAAVLADGSLAVARCVEEDLWEETAEEAEVEKEDAESAGGDGSLQLRASPVQLDGLLALGRVVRRLAWLSSGCLLLLAGPRVGEGAAGDVLIPLRLTEGADGDVEAAVGADVPVAGAVQLMAALPGEEAALLQLGDGSLLRFCATTGGPPQPLASSFPRPCVWMAPLPADVAGGGGAVPPCPALGLDASGGLHCGRATLARGVTSAGMRAWGPGGAFLLYTTSSNELHTLSMPQVLAVAAGRPLPPPQSAPAGLRAAPAREFGRRVVPIGQRRDGEENHYSHMHAAMRPAGASAASDCTVRRIEAGGVLVAVPPGSHTAVLQMPRGNLEGVEPRHLVLAAVADALRGGNYGAAWRVARASRLDLNVLVDFRWPAFLQNADKFVQAVPTEADVCDLLVALRPASTVAPGGEYAAMCGGGEVGEVGVEGQAEGAGGAPAAEGKVSAVCCAIRAALIANGEERHTIGVLTSHARHCPPELGAALQRIKALREAEVAGGARSGGAADGLRSLLLYSQPEELYRTALALYDLPLAYMVVDVAGLDPGDYLEDLQLWQATQPDAARRAAIDQHLGNWRGALAHLATLPGDEPFDEALRLAREKGLLRYAMHLYKSDTARHAAVMAAYAGMLTMRGMHEDAALAWLAAGQREPALVAYQEAGEWRQALALAHGLGWSTERIKKLAANMAEDMRGHMTPVQAATLHLEYLRDVDGAVALLAQAAAWRDALWTAHRADRADLVKTVVVPAAADAAATLLQDTRDAAERIGKYSARLQEVRAKRLAMSAMMEAEDASALELDAANDSASVISGMSAYTTASTAAGTASSVSGRTPSTVGGRRANEQRRRNKQKKKGGRIRQGTAGEERALAEHIRTLEPPSEDLGRAGQLCELLVTHGHVEDAARIQAALAELIAAAQAAKADVDAHPLPEQPEGGDAAGEARAKAKLGVTAWKWDILRDPEQK
eukprot:jgi/Tetstr1/424565/TSEL_015091.t1